MSLKKILELMRTQANKAKDIDEISAAYNRGYAYAIQQISDIIAMHGDSKVRESAGLINIIDEMAKYYGEA